MKKDRDVDLLKIQLLKDSFNTHFNIASSILVSGYIALLVVIITNFYQKIFDIISFTICALSVFIILGFLGLRFLYRRYDRFLDKINSLLMQVEKGEPLPSLNELRKMKIEEVLLKRIEKVEERVRKLEEPKT
jgi:hypothetical protein